MTAENVVRQLSSTRFRFDSEAQLQEMVAALLPGFEREVSLSPADRIDFLGEGVGLEVKVDAPTAAVIRQLHRYAQSEQVSALVLLTNRARHLSIPREMNSKPVNIVFTEQAI